MKVVLFCGGLGMRLREHPENVPKPMVLIGYRPIIWHLMKYYAHFGHKDFILCLGYRGDAIKDYFLNYEECVSNDFVLTEGGKKRKLLNSDISDWRITFVDTGQDTNIGQRLRAVQKHLAGEREFLANYSDGLTDMLLPDQLDHFRARDKVAGFLSVRPNLSYHFVESRENGDVASIRDMSQTGLRVNGGFFVFKSDIFNYLRAGEDLVAEPFHRLLAEQQLLAYKHDGFWLAVDTAKDKQRIDDLYAAGRPPWQLWMNGGEGDVDPHSSKHLPDAAESRAGLAGR
jgi:glucose-1-phosphate cytidylyltransferase